MLIAILGHMQAVGCSLDLPNLGFSEMRGDGISEP